MHDKEFHFAWPDFCTVAVEISWTKPAPHDLLFSGHLEEDQTAYFYSVVAYTDKRWVPYYIGMTHSQSAAIRNRQSDHISRLSKLKEKFPAHTFSICLGTPTFVEGKPNKETIEAVEGLLIYANWHEEMINERKIKTFCSHEQIYLRNTGFSEHIEHELAYGVMYRSV
jgi:hypothetical protein